VVAQGFVARKAATFMNTAKAWREALMAFAAGFAKTGSHGDGTASGASSAGLTVTNNCGTVLLGPFVSPYRSIAWPIYLASCFAASFSIALPIYLASCFAASFSIAWPIYLASCFASTVFCVLPRESEAGSHI
jgi:hypothetical protein